MSESAIGSVFSGNAHEVQTAAPGASRFEFGARQRNQGAASRVGTQHGGYSERLPTVLELRSVRRPVRLHLVGQPRQRSGLPKMT